MIVEPHQELSRGLPVSVAGIVCALSGFLVYLFLYLAPLFGLVGLVLSIIDLVRGRKWAMLALILSVAVPLISLAIYYDLVAHNDRHQAA